MITYDKIDVKVDDRRITLADARECFNGCIPGWKMYAESNGFDWAIVVKKGLLTSELLATDDIMANRLVEFVYNRRTNHV